MESQDIKYNYDTLWKFIIRPPRDEYTEEELGESHFIYHRKTYTRTDYSIISSEGYTLKCSFIQPDPECRPKEEMPVVIYLHGNSSSRLEGLRMANILLKKNINFFIFCNFYIQKFTIKYYRNLPILLSKKIQVISVF